MSLRQQKKARARADILSAAGALISEQGIDKCTTRAIARRAGISYQTLYNYFPGKLHIIRALVAPDATRWLQQVEQLIKQYSGDLVSVLVEIDSIGVAVIQGEQRNLWEAIAFMMFQQKRDDEELSVLNQVAHEHIYSLLLTARGMGHLEPHTDLHLMAYTLFSLSDYAMLRFCIQPMDITVFLTQRREQIALLVSPYQTVAAAAVPPAR